MESRDLKGRAHHFLRWRRRARERRPARVVDLPVDHDAVEVDVLFEAHEERFRTGEVRARRRR